MPPQGHNNNDENCINIVLIMKFSINDATLIVIHNLNLWCFILGHIIGGPCNL
jgi:hypothetical protein